MFMMALRKTVILRGREAAVSKDAGRTCKETELREKRMAVLDFTDRTVVVIGATAGIGRATALAFAASGANVVAAGLGDEDGRSLEAEIRALGVTGLAVFGSRAAFPAQRPAGASFPPR